MAHIFLWISYLNFKGVRDFPGWTFIVTFIFPYLSLLSVNLALSMCACNIPDKSAKLSRNCYNFPQQLKVNPMLSHRFTLQFKNTTNAICQMAVWITASCGGANWYHQKQIHLFCFYKFLSFVSLNIFLLSPHKYISRADLVCLLSLPTCRWGGDWISLLANHFLMSAFSSYICSYIFASYSKWFSLKIFIFANLLCSQLLYIYMPIGVLLAN